MMKKTVLVTVTTYLLINSLINSTASASMKDLKWFSNSDCTELNIVKYNSLSEKKLIAEVTLKNKLVVDNFVSRINSLPTIGDEKVKFGKDVELTTLSFKCGVDVYQGIEIYGKKIKTPSTGFINSKNPIEDVLVSDLDSLVHPQLNKRILKIEGHRFIFKDFQIVYKGDVHTPQPVGGPTIGPTSKSYYSVWANDQANEVNLAIFSGQIPPQPQNFAVGKTIYTLFTFKGLSGDSIFPNYFEIAKSSP
ncbi:MAG: hypothetical protein K2Q18_17075 [Bdellovibrionales bacterium]|nr:hypothetical protein [Bdellovibrionales bacterium]